MLSSEDVWMSFIDLSGLLNSSTRLLKEDVVFLRNNFSYFNIRTSNDKIRLTYKQNKGIKNVYQDILSHSSAFVYGNINIHKIAA